MLRVFDINLNKVIYETFFECEVKKIVQVNGQIYIIYDRSDQLVAIVTADMRIQNISNIEGEFL